MEILIFIICVWLCVYLYIRLKRRFFNRFIDASKTRILVWKFIKCSVMIVLSVIFIIKGCERWYYFHDEIEYTDKKFLDMSYIDQLDMQVYLMDQEKLISLFKGNPPTPGKHIASSERNVFPSPTDPYFYLVIRIKNKGDRIVWGSLDNRLNEKYLRSIDIPPLPPNMKDFTNIVLWWQETEENLPKDYPNLGIKWKAIYTSQGDTL
ncbi:MAG: hypothetical protein JSS09_03530 [Verrucomicrobia bacterium]|nr:hypothetical protein [Verrucomicrobiota bacterium]